MNEKLLRKEWYSLLADEWDKQYMVQLRFYLNTLYLCRQCYPEPNLIFNAYNLVPPDKVRVVMIGQDPYHNGHAHGLAFSSLDKTTPYSLKVIFKEIARTFSYDLKEAFPTNDLTCWAEQGVLLINPVLTVDKGQALSHARLGWEDFTDAVLKKLYAYTRPLVFVTWGRAAQSVFARATGHGLPTAGGTPHLQLSAGHPAAGAYGRDTFSGCGHFQHINTFLSFTGTEPINWTTNDTRRSNHKTVL